MCACVCKLFSRKMENRDDSDFEDFVLHALNFSFSSNVNDDDSHFDPDDILINNLPDESEIENDECTRS